MPENGLKQPFLMPIKREAGNAAALQLIDARLRRSTVLCRLKLRPAFLLNQLLA